MSDLLFLHFSHAQKNLIVNPGIEDFICEKSCGTSVFSGQTCGTWFSLNNYPIENWGIYLYCNENYYVKQNNSCNNLFLPCGTTNLELFKKKTFHARQGQAHLSTIARGVDIHNKNISWGGEGRLNLVATLTQPLKKDCVYKLNYYVLNANRYGSRSSNVVYIDVFDAKFLIYTVGVAVDLPGFIRDNPVDISNAKGRFLDDTTNYMPIEGTYKAKGNEKYILFGQLREMNSSNIGYYNPSGPDLPFFQYYLDDFSLTAIPPDHLKLSLGKDTILCGKDQPLKLVAQQGFDSYKWNTGDTSRIISVSKAGTYIVQVDFGCGVLSDTIVVKAYPYKKNQLQIGEQLQKCPEEQISLKAANGYNNYTWSNGQTGAELSTSQEGMYIIQATSPEACLVRDTVQIFNISPPKAVYLGKDTVICLGKSILLDAGNQSTVSFVWNKGSYNQTIEVKEAGNYSVSVSNKCFQTSDTIVVSTKDCSPIFIPNVFTPNGDGKNDTFKIRTEDNRTVNLDVYNRWGDKIYSHSNYSDHWTAESIPDGMYFYQITDIEYAKTEKGWVQVIR